MPTQVTPSRDTPSRHSPAGDIPGKDTAGHDALGRRTVAGSRARRDDAAVGGGERGGAVGVEMALLWGAMLLMIAAAVQVGLWFYAGQLALTAAEDGLRAGRYLHTPSAERARAQAQTFLDRTAGGVLGSPTVTAELDLAGGLLRVEVTGTVVSVVPGLDLRVQREAAGAIEQVVP